MYKQFFTELIDFIDHAESVDLADVNPEYLDLGRIVERLPEGYKKSRIRFTVSEMSQNGNLHCEPSSERSCGS
jgi:hypothetical protein